MRPGVTLFARNVLDDVVGGRAEHILGDARLVFRNARAADPLVEFLDRVGDLVHQIGEVRAHQRNAQASEQKEKRARRLNDRIVVRRDGDVAL